MLALTLKNALPKSNLTTNLHAWIDVRFKALLYTLSPSLLVRYSFLKQRKKLPNLKNPKSFDEKLVWLILYWRHPLKTQCADKFGMRNYVEKNGMAHILPPIVGVYNSTNEIDVSSLPDRFVLKCTHGCGFNIICKNKRELDWPKAKNKLDSWMKEDISKYYGEIHYTQIKPRIICENFLEDSSGDRPTDYKVFCFNGKAFTIMVCTQRSSSPRAKYDWYDLEWSSKVRYSSPIGSSNSFIPKPAALEEIIRAAEILSRPFPFVRMDFYSINGKAIIGEMTFTPNGGVDVFLTDRAQELFGQMVQLPEKILK